MKNKTDFSLGKRFNEELKAMKIMIVDDSKFGRGMVHTFAKTIFPEAKFLPAKNGFEALDLFKKHLGDSSGFDMIFLDYLMPEMDGVAAAGKILKMDQNAFIVMITSNLQDPIRDQALKLGIKYFFNKPIKKSDLLSVKQLWEETRG